ncbi:hypothetical protein Q1695_000891 [Nippostrongylus brasiliensis]|nr:hypothetical protein Q1695_000891 [Nippostrongylus brasiliensis]
MCVKFKCLGRYKRCLLVSFSRSVKSQLPAQVSPRVFAFGCIQQVRVKVSLSCHSPQLNQGLEECSSPC